MGSVSRTSEIRPADTAARGSIINIIDSIKKEKMMCIAYCIKAIISPTCKLDSAIWCAPTQMISNIIPFIMTIINGIITANIRPMNNVVFVSSRLTFSNLSSSKSCVTKARMTISPDRFSLETKFKRSMSSWIFLNFGTAIANKTEISPNRMITASAMIQDIETLLSKARMIPPIPMIGAKKTIRTIITVTIWICVISFVVRVINEAVENLSNS